MLLSIDDENLHLPVAASEPGGMPFALFYLVTPG